MTNRNQLFVSPMGDGVAKYLLSNEKFRNYILSILSGESIQSSVQLDDHLNPFESYKDLRALINSSEFEKECDKFFKRMDLKNEFASILNLTSFYQKKLKEALPVPPKNSQVDFKCETNFGYITIEFQLIDHPNWDDRAFAYVAHIFGHQVKKGDVWRDGLKRVIGINLLGYKKGPFWIVPEFIRHYMFSDIYNPMKTMPHLQLIQYSLGDIDFNSNYFKAQEKKMQDVMRFFRLADELTELPKDIDIALREGYEMINDSGLKEKEPEIYDKQHKFWSTLSLHNENLKNEGREEGKAEGKEEGLKEGIEKGMEKGREEGRKEGREAGIREMLIKSAKIMLECNIAIEDVLQKTGLQRDDLEEN